MAEVIKCPECGADIELTEVLKKRLAKEVEADFDNRLATALKAERARAEAETETLNEKLELAQKNELGLRKERAALEERAKSLELEVQRKVDSERAAILAKALKEAEDGHRLKDAEKDKKLSDTLAQVEELKRRIEQGSQKVQGEVLEVALEEMLKAEFPLDAIEPVASGVKGGDILQTVRSRSGEEAGKMLWELKRTRSFSDSWIPKLKSDARNAKASVCILATEAMPQGMDTFGMVDGVWVTHLKDCVPVSRLLRFGLTQVARERLAQSGRKSKAEAMYDYLVGDEFRGRIEALLDVYKGMREDLESERRAMERLWAKREKAISQMTLNIAGMHGEMQALAGDGIQSVKLLELGGK